jgi:hypothetical protein
MDSMVFACVVLKWFKWVLRHYPQSFITKEVKVARSTSPQTRGGANLILCADFNRPKQDLDQPNGLRLNTARVLSVSSTFK